MQRKLASIQRVLDITPILTADAIELVRINGWQVVVKKGEFRVGDLGVFLEIDAIPPETDVFRFLWTPKAAPPDGGAADAVPAVAARPPKFRIRTMRLRGALSQGLFLPVVAFPGVAAIAAADAAEGDDVTEALGVGKYEPPAPAHMGDWRGPFPGFVPKTDEMRIQSVPAVLDELRGRPYVITLKVDGTSATYCIDPRDGEFHACGRNHSIADGANLYWQMARKYDIEAALRRWPRFVLQGEIAGPRVQKNLLGLPEAALFAFNVYDLDTAGYLGHDDARAFLADAGIPAVDVIESGLDFAHTQESLLALAEGKYDGTKNEREGIVIRPRVERFSETLGGRLSFKAISNRYLLKEEDA
jgi:RNA ligase (TIGR02306 family)